jgi:hypothetical protein
MLAARSSGGGRPAGRGFGTGRTAGPVLRGGWGGTIREFKPFGLGSIVVKRPGALPEIAVAAILGGGPGTLMIGPVEVRSFGTRIGRTRRRTAPAFRLKVLAAAVAHRCPNLRNLSGGARHGHK